ncbi:hypothetical protein EHS25_007495 [Saitozyma podzolica]|uniref:DNA/RNA-binding protein Kin17 WH-like domain-containing protein n=1 Tax=Saitozyma podzolica TaxID=1890683 RepID=A0A427YPW9_9TREE|nr:hypothetical protein EHS25_007495 [Saitozyma podzolica]
MGKGEPGSTKAIANAIKAKGLGRLRWYCQICEKQCRDENGFQAHCRSEPHLRKIMLVGPKAGATIAEFSRQFQYEFVTLLRTRHQTNRVQANKVYNEYIQDKHHVHMNATRWVTLSGFVQTLGKAGTVKVEEDDKGIWITWIDNRPETLSKQAALQKRDRAQMDGEERERLMLEEQIKRARATQGEDEEENKGLQKKEGEKITLSLAPIAGPGPGPSTSSNTAEAGSSKPADEAKPLTSISFGTLPAATPTVSINPLKRPAPVNVFKAAKAPKTESNGASRMDEEGLGAGKKVYKSEAERLMKEDQARKAMRGNGGGGGGGYGGFGPKRDTSAPRRSNF